MFDHILIFLKDVLLPIGAWGVFFASILEEIVAPIPSSVVIFLSGLLFLEGTSGISTFLVLMVKVAIPAALGVTIGSLFVFTLGYIFGKPFFVRWGKYFGITLATIEDVEKKLKRSSKDETVLLVARIIPVIPSVLISATFGVLRMSLWRYTSISFVGLIPRAAFLGYLGFVAGGLYEEYAAQISLYENTVLSLVIAIVLIWVLSQMVKRRRRISSSQMIQ